jgi:pilus assembly protein FimV
MVHRSGLVFVALLAVPLAAPAAGLGRLAVMSRTGEPLNTEIDIVSVQGNEGESLVARVAPADVYRSAHIAPVPPIEVLRAVVERKADGRPVVRVTSTEPIDKPLVNLLVELSWTGGTPIVRQYSFLLDTLDRKPPPVAFTPPAPAADTAAAKPAEAPPPSPAPPAAPAAAAAAPEPGGTYAVQSGDSLLKIAQATKYDGVTFAQTVVAIYRANEDAFIGGDMSRLKSDRTLKIPDRDAVAAVNADEARQAVAALRGQPEAPRGRPAPVAREPGPAGDDAVARERALAESRERATALEQTRDDLKRLIEARDKEIADLERQVGAKSAGKSQPIKKPAP